MTRRTPAAGRNRTPRDPYGLSAVSGYIGPAVAVVAAVFVILRLQQVFQPPIALFILALVVVAEATLSVER